MKFILSIFFFFILNIAQTHAQSIVRTFNSDAFITAYINGAESTWMEKSTTANERVKEVRAPNNSCVYETETKTVDGKIVKSTENKRCHEEIPLGEKKDSAFSNFIKTPFGETLIVLSMAILAQKLQ